MLGASAAEQATIEARPFYVGQYELIGTPMGSPAEMRDLMRMVAEHAITPPPIGRTFALTDAARAHESPKRVRCSARSSCSPDRCDRRS